MRLLFGALKLRWTIKTNFLHKIKPKAARANKAAAQVTHKPEPLWQTQRCKSNIFKGRRNLCTPAKTTHFYESARCVRVFRPLVTPHAERSSHRASKHTQTKEKFAQVGAKNPAGFNYILFLSLYFPFAARRPRVSI